MIVDVIFAQNQNPFTKKQSIPVEMMFVPREGESFSYYTRRGVVRGEVFDVNHYIDGEGHKIYIFVEVNTEDFGYLE